MTTATDWHARATRLQLHGLIAHWSELAEAPWIESLLGWEETERARRSQERRMRNAQLGRFKPLADFDWLSPRSSRYCAWTSCARAAMRC
jgi:hypothetical protein